jgi:hypothetical protein
MDRVSQLISRLFWAFIVFTLNVSLERQFIRRIERQHRAIAATIGDFSGLHEYVGRHRRVESTFA